MWIFHANSHLKRNKYTEEGLMIDRNICFFLYIGTYISMNK